MGQYHYTVNITKKEFIDPHKINNGLKLMEQVGWEGATANALFLLLASSNGRGGGDAEPHPLIGHWAGDKIAVIGDYCIPTDIQGIDTRSIFQKITEDAADNGVHARDPSWVDISEKVREMMLTSLELVGLVEEKLN